SAVNQIGHDSVTTEYQLINGNVRKARREKRDILLFISIQYHSGNVFLHCSAYKSLLPWVSVSPLSSRIKPNSNFRNEQDIPHTPKGLTAY
uniref:Uncharacterized protein n=1 Tax=Glossina palpalis gambiensis TaxID=67801 RepID=A0A1B0BRA8_9MUSC